VNIGSGAEGLEAIGITICIPTPRTIRIPPATRVSFTAISGGFLLAGTIPPRITSRDVSPRDLIHRVDNFQIQRIADIGRRQVKYT
jgi:hypothetical protein